MFQIHLIFWKSLLCQPKLLKNRTHSYHQPITVHIHFPSLHWLTIWFTNGELPHISAFTLLIQEGKATYTLCYNPVILNHIELSLHTVGGGYAPYTPLHNSPLPEDEDKMLKIVDPAKYHEYLDIFTWKDAKAVPPHCEYDHTIEIEHNAQPPFRPIYPLSGIELQALCDYLEDMLGKGFIQESQSPGRAPVLFSKKEEGTLCLCVNYHALNQIT